jgi:hypothetical protein
LRRSNRDVGLFSSLSALIITVKTHFRIMEKDRERSFHKHAQSLIIPLLSPEPCGSRTRQHEYHHMTGLYLLLVVRFFALLLYAGVPLGAGLLTFIRRHLSASIPPKLAQYRLRSPDIPHRLFHSAEYERANQPGHERPSGSRSLP